MGPPAKNWWGHFLAPKTGPRDVRRMRGSHFWDRIPAPPFFFLGPIFGTEFGAHETGKKSKNQNVVGGEGCAFRVLDLQELQRCHFASCLPKPIYFISMHGGTPILSFSHFHVDGLNDI
jgi:hypothetical protein